MKPKRACVSFPGILKAARYDAVFSVGVWHMPGAFT